MINGKGYYISDISSHDAVNSEEIRFYVGLDRKGLMIFETESGKNYYSFKFVVEITEPNVNDWTYETCPLPPFTVRAIVPRDYRTLTSICDDGIVVSGEIMSYEELREFYLYIPDPTDRTKELPCGSVDNG